MTAENTPIGPPPCLHLTEPGPPAPPSEPDRRSVFVTLWTGRRWFPLAPSPRDVHAADWHALAYVNRYNGSCGAYSVMEHLVRGTWLAEALKLPVPIRKAYAVHDCPEVVPPADMAGPLVAHLKREAARTGHVDPVLAIRNAAEAAFYERCGVLGVFRDPEQAALVDRLDRAMQAVEKRCLLPGWKDTPLPEWAPDLRVEPTSVDRVLSSYEEILNRYAPALAAEFREGYR